MPTQQKTTGSQVAFGQGWELTVYNSLTASQHLSFRDEVFGIYSYQGAPAVVPASTRDAFFNGDMNDLVQQTWGQGMQMEYALITWNETLQNDGSYLITDAVVGVVLKVTRDYNTGPSYAIDALKAISWFKAFNDKTSGAWKAWQLLNDTTGNRNVSSETVIGNWVGVAKPIGTPLPDLPSADALKQAVQSDTATVEEILGRFSKELLDKGYTVTMQGYTIDVCFEKTPTMRQPGGYIWGYQYRPLVKVSLYYTTSPEFSITQSASVRGLFAITLSVICWIIAVSVLSVSVGIAAILGISNLTHKESSYVKWNGPLLDKNGNIVYDKNGNVVFIPVESGSESGPPDFWQYVIPFIALIGAGAGVFILLQVIPRRKEK